MACLKKDQVVSKSWFIKSLELSVGSFSLHIYSSSQSQSYSGYKQLEQTAEPTRFGGLQT